MSLICCITNYGHPIIISDLAITGMSIGNPIIIPILNKEFSHQDFPELTMPISMRIKNIIVKEKLYVAAAGDVETIIALFRQVEDYFAHRDITETNFKEFDKVNHLAITFKDCSAIFLMSAGDKNVPNIYLFGKWESLKVTHLEQVIYAGTGGSDWSTSIIESSKILNTDTSINPGNTIANVLLKSMQFLEEERNSPDNLKNAWGGGFDVCRFVNGKFCRLDKICYAFWDIDVDDLGKEIKFRNILRFSYIGEALWIQHFDGNFKSYEVHPIHKNLPRADIENQFEFTCNQVVSCVYLVKNGDRSNKLFYIDTSESELIHSTIIDGYLAFGIQTKFVERLKEAISISLS